MLDTVVESTIDEVTLDRVMAMAPTPRVQRMREAYFNNPTTASIERARIEARVMQQTAGEPMITRRAKIFAAAVREMPIDIYPDELLVGCVGVRPRSRNVTPTVMRLASGLAPDIAARIAGTERVPGLTAGEMKGLSEEEKRELTEELIPLWDELGRPKHLWHYGHNIHDYEKVLKLGFLGIKRQAEARLARIDRDDPEDAVKIPFLEGVVIAMEAAAEIGARYAARARALAEQETDALRQSELLRIAEACDQVPARPARTFYEALQAYYFTYQLLFWEVVPEFGFSQGRLDQYLNLYYERDIEEGRITQASAQELIDCYLLKLNMGGGSATIAVGGLKANGHDATNPLSYMFIEGIMHTRLTLPYFAVLIHSNTPDDFLIKASQLCALGTGHPQFLNCDVGVAQALTRGVTGGPVITLEDARAGAPIGCSEVGIPGKDAGYLHTSGATNLATYVELVMRNGRDLSGERIIGVETGDPTEFKSFEEFREAFCRQLVWVTENVQISGDLNEQKIIDFFPTVYES
ncbi:MAG: pyruvate formate lyase family protein, partial [Anaerolineales bacterium]|nr:pyruvate formate lyase family protein [Anaerolineales bacterium]